jgi:hypothetical protein
MSPPFAVASCLRVSKLLAAAGAALTLCVAGCTTTAPMSASMPTAAGPTADPTPTATSSAAEPTVAPVPSPSPTPTAKASPRPSKLPTKAPTKPAPAKTTTPPQPPPAQWQWAPTVGPVLGVAGPLRTFRVAVESGVPVSAASITSLVDSTLGDSGSWIAGNTVRLQHVRQGDPYNFTIYLASPATAYKLCIASGVDIRVNGQPYTSCRAGSNVVLNSDRYLNGVPDYGAPLDTYRQYMINHEVGHWLGHNHELCPGPGQPAPVMQQQTLGLQGCVANSSPYLNGSLYSGPPAV